MRSARWFLAFADCQGVVPSAYFPAVPPGDRRDRLAAQVMARCVACCPVRAECADDALARRASHGFVAGVDLGPGPDPRPEAVISLHQIAGRAA